MTAPRAVLRRLRHRNARLSLRSRLVAGVLVVSAVGLVVASAWAALLLQAHLNDRVDEELHAAQAVLERAEQAAGRRGPVPLPMAEDEDVLRDVLPGFLVRYLDAEGGVSYEFDGGVQTDSPPDLPPLDLENARAVAGSPFDVGTADGSRRSGYRVLVRILPEGRGSVVLAYDRSDQIETVRNLVRIEVSVGLAALALVAALGYAAVRTGLRPLEDVENTAEAIMAGGDLSKRVPDGPSDRTEIGRLATTLNALLAQIEEAFGQRAESEERLRRFVADASHELRTPLAGIRGLAELYRQGVVDDPEEIGRLIARIEAEATRMGLLVEDLLLLARLDQERPLEQRPVDLLPVAADALEAARVLQPGRRLDLVILPEDGRDDQDGPPPLVLGDEARLRQVAENLLTNALAHTPPGTPVTVRVGPVDERAVLLEVTDRGPGLSAEQAARVFERFYRADPARSRRSSTGSASGSGLGLSIVAAIVAAHRGRVEYAPAPGGGATFRVLLPMLSAPHPPGPVI